jgi:hypothetical protein
MRRFALSLALGLVASLPVMALDDQSLAIVERLKPGKLMRIADVGVLMMGSERWCYNEHDGQCAWTDIYLQVTEDGARYEIGNAWDDTVDIVSVDEGVFRDRRYICETNFDWVPTVRAFSRDDGSALFGRDLDHLRQEIRSNLTGERNGCFDYLYRSHDAEAETVTLLQRQYNDGAYDEAGDALVTLYFNKAEADALKLSW